MRSTKILKNCSSSLCTCLHHMVILRTRNKITDFLMILAWASPFNYLVCAKSFGAHRLIRDISKTPSTPSPLDPRPTTLEPRPSTLDFNFFFASLFIKFGKQYQVNVSSPSATKLAERLMYILRRGTIRNIIMLALD